MTDTAPRAFKCRIYLVGGGAVDSVPAPLASDDFATIAHVIGGGAGWQINVETENGWACVPKHSVLYVEMLRA